MICMVTINSSTNELTVLRTRRIRSPLMNFQFCFLMVTGIWHFTLAYFSGDLKGAHFKMKVVSGIQTLLKWMVFECWVIL